METRVNGGMGAAVAEIGGIAVAEMEGIIKLAGLPHPAEEGAPDERRRGSHRSWDSRI